MLAPTPFLTEVLSSIYFYSIPDMGRAAIVSQPHSIFTWFLFSWTTLVSIVIETLQPHLSFIRLKSFFIPKMNPILLQLVLIRFVSMCISLEIHFVSPPKNQDGWLLSFLLLGNVYTSLGRLISKVLSDLYPFQDKNKDL